jgi:hypothetical protein
VLPICVTLKRTLLPAAKDVVDIVPELIVDVPILNCGLEA